MTLTPDQFAALTAYIDAAIIAERHSRDDDGGLIEWMQRREAHDTLRAALVAPVDRDDANLRDR